MHKHAWKCVHTHARTHAHTHVSTALDECELNLFTSINVLLVFAPFPLTNPFYSNTPLPLTLTLTPSWEELYWDAQGGSTLRQSETFFFPSKQVKRPLY